MIYQYENVDGHKKTFSNIFFSKVPDEWNLNRKILERQNSFKANQYRGDVPW